LLFRDVKHRHRETALDWHKSFFHIIETAYS